MLSWLLLNKIADVIFNTNCKKNNVSPINMINLKRMKKRNVLFSDKDCRKRYLVNVEVDLENEVRKLTQDVHGIKQGDKMYIELI